MSDNVNLYITSNVRSFHSERRFPLSTEIQTFKEKVELLTGIPAAAMKLELRTSDNKFMADMSDNNATIGSYQAVTGCIVHVTDPSGVSQQFDEESEAAKFEFSDEQYEKRSDSLRAFKKKLQVGRFNDDEQQKKAQLLQEQIRETEVAAATLKVGQRCEVRLTGQPPKRGTIMFIGATHFKPGHWAGIKYDEPLGKNDGSVEGTRYFECPPKYGAFVRPQDVVPGDFPEENIDENMDEF